MNEVNLQLKTKEQKDLIAGAIRQRVGFLRNQSLEIEKEIADLELLLSQIITDKSNKQLSIPIETTVMDEYKTDWSYSKKAEFVIKKVGVPMSTAAIANYIVQNLEPGVDRKTVVKNLSVIFSTQKNRFIKTINVSDEAEYFPAKLK